MSNIRIMLIDDEPNVVTALQRLLRQNTPAPGRTCTVEAFTSPLRAIDAAQERTVDVVVCDYKMPELDGVETLRRIREFQPQAGRIMLSGSHDFETVLDAINVAHVGRVIIKPWNDVELVSAIRDAVETRRLQVENADLADQLRVQRGVMTQQDAALRRIETMWPGITRIEWAEDGTICISEADGLDAAAQAQFLS